MKCQLDPDINACPFYIADVRGCNNNQNCSFKENDKKKEYTYVCETRWFEQYYNKR